MALSESGLLQRQMEERRSLFESSGRELSRLENRLVWLVQLWLTITNSRKKRVD